MASTCSSNVCLTVHVVIFLHTATGQASTWLCAFAANNLRLISFFHQWTVIFRIACTCKFASVRTLSQALHLGCVRVHARMQICLLLRIDAHEHEQRRYARTHRSCVHVHTRANKARLEIPNKSTLGRFDPTTNLQKGKRIRSKDRAEEHWPRRFRAVDYLLLRDSL